MSMKAEYFNAIPERFRKYFKPATVKDADYVAEHMCQESIRECTLAVNHTPVSACYKGLALSSFCVTIIDPETGEIFGMGGVTSSASIWMFLCEGYRENRSIRRLLIRESKPFLKWLMEESGHVDHFLENFIVPDSARQLRWLEWLGAETERCQMNDEVDFITFLFAKHKNNGS